MSIIYKNFKCGTLFDIHPTKAYKMSNKELLNIKGMIPVLSNSSFNNGICGYSNYEPTEKGGIITFSDTTTGADTMFYQPDDFIGYSHVQGMYPYYKEYWDKYTLLYFISAMKKASGSHWNYSNKFNRALVSEIEPLLPVKKNKDNEPLLDIEYKYHKEGYIPDFDYMREVIKKIEQDKIKELEQDRVKVLEQYLIVTGLNDYKLTDEDIEILSLSGFGNYKELDNKDSVNICKNFKVSDLFIVEGTKSLDAGALIFKNNGVNFVGRTGENNGIQGKIDKQSFEPNEANTITATVIGNYKYVKYQQEPYYCSQNINKLTPKFNINEYLGLWFRSEIQKFVSLYDHQQGGYKLDEIKNFEFHLPVQTDKANNPIIDETCQYHSKGYIPDWDFMEKYIKAIEKIVIADVVKYKDSVIEKTKVVVNQ